MKNLAENAKEIVFRSFVSKCFENSRKTFFNFISPRSYASRKSFSFFLKTQTVKLEYLIFFFFHYITVIYFIKEFIFIYLYISLYRYIYFAFSIIPLILEFPKIAVDNIKYISISNIKINIRKGNISLLTFFKIGPILLISKTLNK